ncbi:hypothetical protein NP493_611g01038 [Ridgeia piscesae]|uniref:Uncharacterized protein n=1 Tax=Ridgeia piscesae TaxID=27915 RepID=A0AAD9KTW8_RIDPI|nr:hypothetical protein NP493_611g01038 [Ridgeia piscesae]
MSVIDLMSSVTRARVRSAETTRGTLNVDSAPRRSRRVTSYNKNAAYEEELQKDEERRLLLRAKRYAHRHQANHVTTTRVVPKQLCRLRSARQNRVLANRKRKQEPLSASIPSRSERSADRNIASCFVRLAPRGSTLYYTRRLRKRR